MLVVCETDRGRWSVRPAEWAGEYDFNTGRISESGCAHIAIFESHRDARQYAAIVNACEERRNNERVSR